MSEAENTKKEIIEQIGELSRLLGMVPSGDAATVNEPVTNESMELSKWFVDARNSFLKLSTLVDRALELNLQ